MARDYETWLTDDESIIAEKTTAKLAFVVQDEAGVAIPAASLTTLVATLYVRRGGAIINSRTAQSILNANGGTVDAGGNGTLILVPADNAIVSATGAIEDHDLLIEWTYNAGAKAGKHLLHLRVANLAKVT